MKKAEEYYYEAAKNYNHNKNEVDILVINTIRKAQMDSIELTYDRIMAAIWKNIDNASELAKMRNVVDELLKEVANKLKEELC